MLKIKILGDKFQSTWRNDKGFRTYVTTYVLVMTIILLLASHFAFKAGRAEKERRKRNADYNAQIKELENTQRAITNLTSFIENQRERLTESQDVLESLKKEQEKLKPVVMAYRQTVEAILDAQAQRQSANVWKERFIGGAFTLGVSAIWQGMLWGYRRRVTKQAEAIVLTSLQTGVSPTQIPPPSRPTE